ncbi:MAG: hypothetical protein Q9168_001448 [Polycauliona sp. 1 TL-2023]
MVDSVAKHAPEGTQSPDAIISKSKKFSDFLTSPIFSVVAGEENAKTFLIHSELLAHESDRLAMDVKSGFYEGSSRSILLHEEDSELFGYFVEYLYRGEWIAEEQVRRESDYIVLARLYTLGERLQAHKFQFATLRKFTSSFGSQTSLSDQTVCELLDIACTELPERIHEDPLRAQIFWSVVFLGSSGRAAGTSAPALLIMRRTSAQAGVTNQKVIFPGLVTFNERSFT